MPTEQIIRYKSPLNTTAEDAFAWDEDQAKQYIVTEAGNFAIQVGYEKNSEEYNNYIQKEKDLYSKIQQPRKQKHLDGTYKMNVADGIINEANKIYTKQYRKDLADGFSRSEAKIKADEAADDYIYRILEENGL